MQAAPSPTGSDEAASWVPLGKVSLFPFLIFILFAWWCWGPSCGPMDFSRGTETLKAAGGTSSLARD